MVRMGPSLRDPVHSATKFFLAKCSFADVDFENAHKWYQSGSRAKNRRFPHVRCSLQVAVVEKKVGLRLHNDVKR